MKTFKMASTVVIMDKILMEMSKMWKVTDGHMGGGMDHGQQTLAYVDIEQRSSRRLL